MPPRVVTVDQALLELLRSRLALGPRTGERFLRDDFTWADPPTGGGGGGGAPTDAQYVVSALHAGLSAERVLTGVAGETSIDVGTAGQAKVGLTPHLSALDPHPQYAFDSDLTSGLAAKQDAATAATDAELSAGLATKANTSHTHPQGDITNLVSDLAGKAPTVHGHDWADISGEPATYPPTAHTHDWADITGEPPTYPPSSHAHDAADITTGTMATARLGSGTANNTTFLRGDQTWAVPPAGSGSASITEVEIDFGSVAQRWGTFTIVDAAISATDKLLVGQSGRAATGRQADENELERLLLVATPQAGSMLLHVTTPRGYRVLQGKWIINYMRAA